jgi:hypothetical protein
VFTARYALSPYIKQIRFVFKGLRKYFRIRPEWLTGGTQSLIRLPVPGIWNRNAKCSTGTLGNQRLWRRTDGQLKICVTDFGARQTVQLKIYVTDFGAGQTVQLKICVTDFGARQTVQLKICVTDFGRRSGPHREHLF